jgi:hypothetical protein
MVNQIRVFDYSVFSTIAPAWPRLLSFSSLNAVAASEEANIEGDRGTLAFAEEQLDRYIRQSKMGRAALGKQAARAQLPEIGSLQIQLC